MPCKNIISCSRSLKVPVDLKVVNVKEKNKMGGACGAYGGGERCVPGSGGETWVKETSGETQT
jgi:hypothetical protein